MQNSGWCEWNPLLGHENNVRRIAGWWLRHYSDRENCPRFRVEGVTNWSSGQKWPQTNNGKTCLRRHSQSEKRRSPNTSTPSHDSPSSGNDEESLYSLPTQKQSAMAESSMLSAKGRAQVEAIAWTNTTAWKRWNNFSSILITKNYGKMLLWSWSLAKTSGTGFWEACTTNRLLSLFTKKGLYVTTF